MKRYKAIIFDLDGTLLNTIEDLADAVNAVLVADSLPLHDIDRYKVWIGEGVYKLIERSLPHEMKGDEEMVSRYVAAFNKAYEKNAVNKSRPYDGVMEMIYGIKELGIPMTVLSNKPHEFTVQTVAQLLGDHFERVYGQREGVPRKPDPAAARQIADELGVAPADVLYLGDSHTDMQTATAAGMFPLGALWGYKTKKEILHGGAKSLIDKPMDIFDYLTS